MLTLLKRTLAGAGICLCLSLAVAGGGKNAAPSAVAEKGSKSEPAGSGKDLGIWVKKLKDKDPDVRLAAAKALGEQGPAAKSAAPELAAAAKACTWEMFVLEEELAGGKTFATVGAPLGVLSEEEREKYRKQAEKEQAAAQKVMEKIKPLRERLHKEEKILMAVLEALEKTDPSELGKLGLDQHRLTMVKAALGKQRKGYTFPIQTIPNPAPKRNNDSPKRP